ncbi:A disintegrin and metalloproteinase with thrombospondin motifs 3 [Dissostichus eleginoides]|nr:A disintegrin and metalloproteinase with thrombospondin motifs 3 [Dissostichus eleginoides]
MSAATERLAPPKLKTNVVCGGDNSHCRTVKGSFTRTPKKPGKTRGAFSLPKGARNVYLNETEDSRNVLARHVMIQEHEASLKFLED